MSCEIANLEGEMGWEIDRIIAELPLARQQAIVAQAECLLADMQAEARAQAGGADALA
jgi:hypothetical protein